MEVIDQQQYDQLRQVQARTREEVMYDDPAEQRGLLARQKKIEEDIQHDYDEVTIEGGITSVGGVPQRKVRVSLDRLKRWSSGCSEISQGSHV